MTASEYRRLYARSAPADSTLTAKQYQEQAAGKNAAKARICPKSRQSESDQQSGQQCGEVKLQIKPLSVNLAWKGQRFKTDAYRNYEKAVLLMLPQITLPEPPFKLCLVFGFSNYAADLDNPCKNLVDILQKAYGFNDKHITELNIKKELVAKGSEFITFHILTA